MRSLLLSLRGTLRSPTRALLTISAVAVAVFLFATVTSLERGLRRMLETTARNDVLVVFDRFQGCPPLSKLPAAHRNFLAEIPGISGVTAELFVVSSCSRATDLVAVHGIEADAFREFRSIRIDDDTYGAFAEERSAALVGRRVAARYGWQVGQNVSLERLGGLSFTVRGIFEAPGDSLENAILVDLEYLQLATGQPGKVTLYYARLAAPELGAAVASEIDALLSSSPAPTRTTPERTFMDTAVAGVAGLVEFAALLGYGSLGLVVVGVGNSLAMSMRDRAREIAILKVVGFRRPQVLRLMLGEATFCSLVGGILGGISAYAVVNLSHFGLSVEGFTFSPHLPLATLLQGLLLAVALGTLAGYLPARHVSRLPVAKALREVD